MIQLYDPHVVDRAVFLDDNESAQEPHDVQMQYVARRAAHDAWLLDDNVTFSGPELVLSGIAELSEGEEEDGEEEEVLDQARWKGASAELGASGDVQRSSIDLRPTLGSLTHSASDGSASCASVGGGAVCVTNALWPSTEMTAVGDVRIAGPHASHLPLATEIPAPSSQEPVTDPKWLDTPEHSGDAVTESNLTADQEAQQMLPTVRDRLAALGDLRAKRVCGFLILVLVLECIRAYRRRPAYLLRVARARLRTRLLSYGAALAKEAGEPKSSWRSRSISSGFVFSAGLEARLNPDLCRSIAHFALEPRPRVPEESLECLPQGDRRRLFALRRCSLGTPLAHAGLSRRLGNLYEWTQGAEEPLVACFPSGAYPWAEPTHKGMLGIWSGPGGRYTKDCPVGEPALKIPVAALTAVDCQNLQVRLEFSFMDSALPGAPWMRPAKLHDHLGTLLLLDFAEQDGGGIGEVAEFLKSLHAAARAAGASYEAMPDLPTQGALLPSFAYCRATRQAAELAWALLNLAFVVMPLRQIYKMGILSLDAQGVLGLIMARPGEALKPVTKLAGHIGKFNATRKRLPRFQDILSRFCRTFSARQA